MGVESTLPQPTKLQNSPSVLGLSELLTWLLNDDVGNGLNVASDVNVNVNDVNDVNGASNANTVADENKLLINQFPKYRANIKLIRNIFSVSPKVEASVVYAYAFVYIHVVYVFLYCCCLHSEKKLFLMLGKI